MNTDTLSKTFFALADPTRRAILDQLVEGEKTVTELSEPFAISSPAITKHLKVLEQAGLISRSRKAQWRPARLEAQALRDATFWLEEYRRFWDGSLNRLEDYLLNLQADPGNQKQGKSTR